MLFGIRAHGTILYFIVSLHYSFIGDAYGSHRVGYMHGKCSPHCAMALAPQVIF